MPDAAGLGRRVWDHARSRAGDMPAQFTPQTRDDVTGWLWEGPFATLIREAIPGVAGTDLRRAREYLHACGMVVNVRAGQRGAQAQWFIPPAGTRDGAAMCMWSPQPVPGGPSETPAHQPGQDIGAALQSLAQQVSKLQADNDRLRADYDRLSAEIARIRALMRQVGGAIAQRAGQLLAGAGE
jgi:hypothetical protein